MINRYQELRPDQLLEKIQTSSLAIIPIGSMEWHGRHMNFGMDSMHAEKISEIVCNELDGVILPTLYIGTEVQRTPRQLKNLGFKGDEHIIGVDFPSNTVPSMYFSPELVHSLVDAEVSFIKDIGFKTILIINGHGAEKQIEILKDIATRYSDEKTRVLSFLAFSEKLGEDLGHACLLETSIMMSINKECVDLTKLPRRPVLLRFTDNGFYDGKAICGCPNKARTVEFDPRDATAELGEKSIKAVVEEIISAIEQ